MKYVNRELRYSCLLCFRPLEEQLECHLIVGNDIACEPADDEDIYIDLNHPKFDSKFPALSKDGF